MPSGTSILSRLSRGATWAFRTTLDADFRWEKTGGKLGDVDASHEGLRQIDPARCIPYLFLHLGCLFVFAVGWSPTAIAVAAALYFIRMFAITGFYHRYFSHRTFRTSRAFQTIMAIWGGTSLQRGALWWAGVHRHHHSHSDEEVDAHSPRVHGFIWSHIGWLTDSRNFPTAYHRLKDLTKFPELVFLNRFYLLVPIGYALALYALGSLLATLGLATSGAQILVWGFFVSTVFLLHGTLFINSLAHTFGTQRFETGDDSRNSLLLALITLGEGWHNNHHRYHGSTRQGFYWWEFDPTYYALKLLSYTGLVWDLRPVPIKVYEEAAAPKG